MNDGWAWWLVIVGIAIGVGLAWLLMGRLPRTDADVAEDERAAEANWISRNIAAYGGVAPEPLVEEILSLHRHYLDGPGLEPMAEIWGEPVPEAGVELADFDLADDDLADLEPTVDEPEPAADDERDPQN